MSRICPWCDLPLKADDPGGVVKDHIIPRSRGGPHERWNLQPMHRLCNIEKGTKLTPEAESLAAQHGVILHEPLPTSWPGSNSRTKYAKVSPQRAARLAEQDGRKPPELKPEPKVKVAIRKVYEVECHTCGAIIDAPRSWDAAIEARRIHLADHEEQGEPAA